MKPMKPMKTYTYIYHNPLLGACPSIVRAESKQKALDILRERHGDNVYTETVREERKK